MVPQRSENGKKGIGEDRIISKFKSMKKLFCLLFITFSLTVSAQNDTISNKKELRSVVSADRINVVYRGISNPLSIAVNGAKSFTASAPGLKYTDGKYSLSPGAGNEVNVIVVYKDKDSMFVADKHTFRIKNVGRFVGLINGFNCSKCVVEMTKEELETAIISTKCEDYLVDIDPHYFEVKYFEVKFENGKTIQVNGKKINLDVMNQIYKLKAGSFFYIDVIRNYFDGSGYYEKTVPIKIIIID